MDAAGMTAQFGKRYHYGTTNVKMKTLFSPSLPKPSCMSHSLSVESFGLPPLLSASRLVPSDTEREVFVAKNASD